MLKNSPYAETYMAQKILVSGYKVEKFEYRNPIKIGHERGYDVPARGSVQTAVKREDNLSRARRNVRHLIWANLSEYTKFLTLTYEKTVLDPKQFKKDFDAFRKNMSNHGFKFKYLYVLERQKERGKEEGNEGCIHAHVVIFNDDYYPWPLVRKLWGKGGIDIHCLEGCKVDNGVKSDEKIRDLGSYVSKYITKDCVAAANGRTYTCSLGLNRPEKYVQEQYRFLDSKDRLQVFDNTDQVTSFKIAERMVDFTYHGVNDYKFEDKNGVEIENTIYYHQGTLKFAPDKLPLARSKSNG